MIHGRPLSCFFILWLKYLHGFAPHDFINLELRHHQYVDTLFVIFLLFYLLFVFFFAVRVLIYCSCSYLLFLFLFLFIVRVLFMVLIYFIVADALPYNALPYNDSVSGFLSVYYCSCKVICFVSISKSFALKIFILLHF